MKELPPATLPLPPLPRQLDQVCDHFEAAWKKALAGGPRPRLEDFLAGIAGPQLRTLLLELLAVEAHFRRQLGETPSLEEYQQRFPGLPREWLAHELPAPAETRAFAGSEAEPAAAAALRVPGYEIIRELGRGGMGVVYQARQVRLDRSVALKMLHSPQQVSETTLQRFHLEARAAAALDHPNIVPIYEIGESQGQHYFTMAFIEGPSLTALVRKEGLLPWHRAVILLADVAEAVQHAHEQGIIHRDLKPDNILIDRQGQPRVTDFGLAKRCPDLGGPSVPEGNLTVRGQLLGTPSYMAPEQALGGSRSIRPATDVYALGGILYFLLTGKAPFSGDTVTRILEGVVRDEPIAPRLHNPGVPAGLEEICLRCLAKEPAGRYASAAQLQSVLLAWAARHPEGASPFRDPRRSSRSIRALAGNASRQPPPVAAAAAAPTPVAEAPSSPAVAMPVQPTPNVSGQGLWLIGVVAILGVLALVLVAIGLWSGKDRARPLGSSGGQPPAVQPIHPIVAALLKPAAREDFKVQVELLGSKSGPDGERIYQAEDRVRFHIKPERDCYVGIWWVSPEGIITQIFPNTFEADHRITQEGRVLPGKTLEPYRFRVTASTGKELLLVAASTRSWSPLRGRQQGPYLVFEEAAEQQQFVRLRDVIVEPDQPAANGKVAVTELRIPFQVKP